jgi:hypothetical protein
VSAISEDLKRESVIKQILLSVGAQGYFYKKLKMLVVRDNAKVIDTAITSSKTSGFITPFNKVLASGFNI